MFVASSNVSSDLFGAATNRISSRDLLQRYLSPRQVMSFSPLVDQFATDVKTAASGGARFVFHRSITIGCRVGKLSNPLQRQACRRLISEIPCTKRPTIFETEFACQSSEKAGRVIELIVYLEG